MSTDMNDMNIDVGPTNPSRGDATRARILDAAHQLFLQHGYHGTSMRQIAERAGLAVGGIYNHFNTKDDIFSAVLDAKHPYRAIVPALQQTQAETVEGFVREAGDRVQATIAGLETQLLPLMFMDVVEFQGRHISQLAGAILPQFMTLFDTLKRLKGDVRADLPAPVIVLAFSGWVLGYLVLQMLLRSAAGTLTSPVDGKTWFNGLVEIYLYGIMARPVEPQPEP
jgi:AcrR family transcriptional regulator